MLTYWISLPALLTLLFGIAGLIGTQIYKARLDFSFHQIAAIILGSLLVIMPVLNSPPYLQWIGWILALGIILVYAIRPTQWPQKFWTSRFGWQYLSASMLLITFWGIFIGPPSILLSFFAIAGSYLAWQKSNSPA